MLCTSQSRGMLVRLKGHCHGRRLECAECPSLFEPIVRLCRCLHATCGPAGYETTANALTFTVYLLSRNPGGQTRKQTQWLQSQWEMALHEQRLRMRCKRGSQCCQHLHTSYPATHFHHGFGAPAEKEAKLLAEVDAFGRDHAPTLEDIEVCLAGQNGQWGLLR